MKKSLVLGILGLAACAATSYGQGFIVLDNYNYPGGLVTYGANTPANGVSGSLGTAGSGLLSGWTVGLYYVLGNVSITDPPGTGIPNGQLTLGSGTGATVAVFSTSGTAGQFYNGLGFAVPGGAAGGTATLELIAYDTAGGSYANAAYRGHSAPFTITMQSGTAVPPTANVGPLFSTFSAAPVPEPATLALAGLGGLASLVMLRRKQA